MLSSTRNFDSLDKESKQGDVKTSYTWLEHKENGHKYWGDSPSVATNNPQDKKCWRLLGHPIRTAKMECIPWKDGLSYCNKTPRSQPNCLANSW